MSRETHVLSRVYKSLEGVVNWSFSLQEDDSSKGTRFMSSLSRGCGHYQLQILEGEEAAAIRGSTRHPKQQQQLK